MRDFRPLFSAYSFSWYPNMKWRNDFQQARCLVTGSTSGLGRAFALRLAEQGARVFITGRNAARLQETLMLLRERSPFPLAHESLLADLTIADDRDHLFNQIEHQFGALDVVFNNAGVGSTGQFSSNDEYLLRQIFEINVFAAAEVMRKSLPLLAKGEYPTLVNVGSIVARRALPARAEYCASKFALAGLTESLRAEWARDGVHVILLNPGFTNTPFEKNLLVDNAVMKVTHLRLMSAEAVAEAALRAILRKKNEIALTSRGRALLLMNRLFPRLVDRGMANLTRRLYPNARVPLKSRKG